VANFRKIKDNLKAVSAIETITATYREVSQKEMNDVRKKALKNRDFIEKLSRMCAMAKKSYLLEKKKEGKEEEIVKPKKEKSISIFFSANSRFYGSLILAVWRETLKELEKTGGDLLVVGKVGKNLIEKSNADMKFAYFNLDDEKPSEEEMIKIIEHIKEYDTITAFHGRFKTILSQEVKQTNISGGVDESKGDVDVSSYLFEPSPEAVLEFFEKELIAAFFRQVFLEHRLSRHATRMVAMHKAGENAKERKEKLEKEAKKIQKREMDKKQLEITIPYQLWK